MTPKIMREQTEDLTRTVTVETFGAVGDGVANDVEAFQLAFQYVHSLGGGRVLWGGGGKVYRIAYNSDYPALVMGSHTTFERVGSGYILIDGSLLPTSLPSDPSGRSRILGAIAAGDPDTLTRRQVTLGPSPAVVASGLAESDFVRGLRIINPDVRCEYAGTLTGIQRLYGFQLYFTADTEIIDLNVDGTPNNGLMVAGGWNIKVIRPVTQNCGFNAVASTGRNGISLSGLMVVNHPELSSHDWFVDDVVTNYNRDEGLQFACVAGLVITSVTGKGNLDRLIEGDTSYATPTVTSATYDQEVPNEVIIGSVIYDGLYKDGVQKGTTGMSFGCGNEGRLSIGQVRIRNIAWGGNEEYPAAGGGAISISQNDGGRIFIKGVTIENCVMAQNVHAIYVQSDYVAIGSIEFINCTTLGMNSSLIAINNAISVSIDGVLTDLGMSTGISIGSSKTLSALTYDIRNVRCRGTDLSFIRIGIAGHVQQVSVRDCVATGINATGASDSGFVQLRGASMTVGEMVVRDNTARTAIPCDYPIANAGSGGAVSGMMDKLTVVDNDFDPMSFTLPFSARSYAQTWGDAVIDRNNGILGQQNTSGSAVPTTGTYEQGDRHDNRFPSAGGASYWQCTTQGTFGTLTSIVGSITSGTTALVVNDASGISVGQFVAIAGVSGRKKVRAKSGNNLTLASTADATVAGAAVAYAVPIFKAANLVA